MRRFPALLFAVGVGGAAVLGPAGVAWADTPAHWGWWTSTNPGSLEGSPQPSPPPDVPNSSTDKGLLVEGGLGSTPGATDSGATAYAAVVYQLSTGATVTTLTLTVAPNSATTPGATLEVCPLTKPIINSEEGGSMPGAPAYNCHTNVTAAPSSSGKNYQFNVRNLATGADLAVAILPTSIADRVVFAQPDAQSLAVHKPRLATRTGGSAPVADTSGSPGAATAAGTPTSPSVSGTATEVTPAATPSQAAALPTASAQAPTPSSSNTGQAQTISPAASSNGSGAKPLAAGLIIGGALIGGALWLAVGRAAVRRVVPDLI